MMGENRPKVNESVQGLNGHAEDVGSDFLTLVAVKLRNKARNWFDRIESDTKARALARKIR